jgi:DNA topoisomerase-1
VGPGGETVRDEAIRERIAALAIPPAWQDVWVCARHDGHIQATGRDDEGRKQYIYHPLWRKSRDRAKYRRLAELGARLPELRRRVGRDLAARGPERERVVAGAVRLLDVAALRVGNESYAEDNGSFGLTTLQRRHVTVSGDRVRLRFQGKSGRERDVRVRDPRLADLLRDLRTLPGEDLFVFADAEGNVGRVGPEDVNEYLRSLITDEVSAKDFRTWAASVRALQVLANASPANGDAHAVALEAVDEAAALLGNTRSTAREFYIHPGLLRAFEEGALTGLLESAAHAARVAMRPGFRRGEALLFVLLPRLERFGDGA